MTIQLKDGFENCIKNIKAGAFLVGIGNHDIITCEILNDQINYSGWTLPALSYNYRYILKDNTIINLIFIDTNLYSDEPFCNDRDKSFKEDAVFKQEKWLEEILLSNVSNYNIVIGHIPIITNPHKSGKGVETTEGFIDTILRYKDHIDLYLCADEHNQQYIKYYGINEIISGTGGASLDTEIYIQSAPGMETKYAGCGPGFVGIDINASEISLTLKIKGYANTETTSFYKIPRRVVEF